LVRGSPDGHARAHAWSLDDLLRPRKVANVPRQGLTVAPRAQSGGPGGSSGVPVQMPETRRVPVALKVATAGRPTFSPSSSTETAVTSAVTIPIRTRTRLPT